MVEIEEVFEPDKGVEEKDELLKAVKKFSEKIGESSGTSTFITVEDAINSKSKIFLIKKEDSEEAPVERDFVEV